MRYIIWSLSGFCIITTALPFINAPYWWIRIFDFPRLQIAVLCLLSLVLIIFYKGWEKRGPILLAIMVTISLVYQVSQIVVYTPLYPVQTKPSREKQKTGLFTVMVANILMSNENTGAVKEQVYKYKPDILLLTEPNKRWAEELKELEKHYPYNIKHPLDNTYGMILYSKLPLEHSTVNFLVDKNVPSFYSTVVLRSGGKFDLYAVHPKPPKPGTESYERDTEILLVGKKIRQRNQPAIVIGDLNDVSWSTTTSRFQEYSRLGDPRQGRSLYNTYNAHIPFLRFPLDHIFYSESFGLIDIRKLGHNGSDHFPIFIKLNYEPSMDKIRTLPHIDSTDVEVIRKTIR